MDGYIPTNSAFCTEFIFLHIFCGIENKNSLIISKLPIIKIEDKIVSEIIFYLFVIYWNVFEKGFLWHALTLDFSYYISCFFEFPVLFALLINFIVYFTT